MDNFCPCSFVYFLGLNDILNIILTNPNAYIYSNYLSLENKTEKPSYRSNDGPQSLTY